jgi:hypothetical protein
LSFASLLLRAYSRVFARSRANEFQADSPRRLGTIQNKKTRKNSRKRANALG